jgi:alpha-galactosidase
MDINKDRLNIVHQLAERYKNETKASLNFKATRDRKEALEGADFVLSTVKVVSYENMEAEHKIAEDYGFYRGIGDRLHDYYGGIGAFYRLKFFKELADDMEELCPDAWLIETANPVFEGVNFITRHTKVKTVGVCHGHFRSQDMIKVIGLDPDTCTVQMAGFNHCIWLTDILSKGENAYPLIDEWIDNQAKEYWNSEHYLKSLPWESEQMSPSAVDTYHLYGLFPIGDTVRSMSPWWHHTDLRTKQQWYGPHGGFDSEIGWSIYLNYRDNKLKIMNKFVKDPTLPITDELPPVPSGEQHIPIIDAITNDRETRLQLNIPNKGMIHGLPDDVVVEIPVIVSGRGIQGIHIGNLPRRLLLYALMPRMRRMEQILHAFQEEDKTTLLLMILEDHRARSSERSRALLEELFTQPWNEEAANHYK